MNDSLLDYLKNNLPREEWPAWLKKNKRDVWEKLAWTKVDEWRENQKNQSAVLGDTPDYSRQLFTLDERANRMVFHAFKQYWEDGLIYKGQYMVNWSVGLQTALSDFQQDVEWVEQKDPFVTFEYKLHSVSFQMGDSSDKLDKNSLIEFKNKHQHLSDNYKNHINKAIGSVSVSTVRPETIFGDVAIAIHPAVLQRKLRENLPHEIADNIFDLISTESILLKLEIFYYIPGLMKSKVQLVLSDKVDADFGTGALKITPAHDSVDFNFYKEFVADQKIQPGFEQAIGRDGKLTEISGEFAGLPVLQGRVAVMKKMIENGYIPLKTEFQNSPLEGASDRWGVDLLHEISQQIKSESFKPIEFSYAEGLKRLREILGENADKLQIDWNYNHNVLYCERSKTQVEPLISEEFFISYSNIAKSKGKSLTEFGREGVAETKFYPSEMKERAESILDNLNDWCISRDLVWGHRIPVWYNLDVNPTRQFYNYNELEIPLSRGGSEADGVDAGLSNMEIPQQVRDDKALPFKIQPEKPTEPGNWVQEDKILDTWFSSCLWPLTTLNYYDYLVKTEEIPLSRGGSAADGVASEPSNMGILKQVQDDNELGNTLTDFEKYYPTQVLTTGTDIFYAWILRMIILCKYWTNKTPFENLVITPTLLDEAGKKMSKSLKNGLDPVDQIEKFSSDALRMALLGGMIPNRNMRMGGNLADKLTERYRNFGNKLWNVARFLESKEDK